MKGRERTTKWYFANENEFMKNLGLNPTKGSGSGWIDKEDGENDYIVAQLKSTDKNSYSVKRLDLDKVEYHANISNKIPMFIIQFLKDNTSYALVNLEDIPKIAEYLKFGEFEKDEFVDIVETEDLQPVKKKTIKSSAKAREAFNRKKQEDWDNRKFKK